MRTTHLLLVALSCSILLGPEAIGQCYENPLGSGSYDAVSGAFCADAIPTVVSFLRITPDAHTNGMGDAGIAISPDANSMHLNSSKLAFAPNDFALSANYVLWSQLISSHNLGLAYLAGYKRLNELQTLGFSLRYFSPGDIEYTNKMREPIGFGKPSEFELSLGFAQKISEHFSIGVNGKLIYSNLGTGQMIGGTEVKDGIAGAADVSLYQKVPMHKSALTFGLTLSNLGSKISYTRLSNDYLPANFGLGSAWELFLKKDHSLTIAADVNKLMVPTTQPGSSRAKPVFNAIIGSWSDSPGGFSEELREFTYSIGVEYWYGKQLALRTGFFHQNTLKGAQEYLTLGLGLKYNIVGLNISYLIPATPTLQSSNLFDKTLRFSLLIHFDSMGDDVDLPDS